MARQMRFELYIDMDEFHMRTNKHIAAALVKAAAEVRRTPYTNGERYPRSGAYKQINTEPIKDKEGDRVGGWSIKPVPE